MRFRRIGLCQIAVTDEDKKMMIAITKKKGIEEISKVYIQLNQERQKSAIPKLINPYTK